MNESLRSIPSTFFKRSVSADLWVLVPVVGSLLISLLAIALLMAALSMTGPIREARAETMGAEAGSPETAEHKSPPGDGQFLFYAGAYQTSDPDASRSLNHPPLLLLGGKLVDIHEGNLVRRPFEVVEGELWFTIDAAEAGKIRDNGSTFSLSLLRVRSSGPKHSGERHVSFTLWTGSEHYQPSFTSSRLRWSQPLAADFPSHQYYVWKPLNPRGSWEHRLRSAHLAARVDFAPVVGANSSLPLHDLPEEAEDSLNPIFLSTRPSKQNYYYSYGGFVGGETSLVWNRLLTLRAEARAFTFLPLLRRADARDLVGIGSLRGMIRLRRSMELSVGYAHRLLWGRLEGNAEWASWGTAWMALAVTLD